MNHDQKRKIGQQKTKNKNKKIKYYDTTELHEKTGKEEHLTSTVVTKEERQTSTVVAQ